MGLLPLLGKLLVITGLVIAAMGLLLLVSPKIPWFGKLPGDIIVVRERFSFYLPITTCIIVSIILSVLFYLLRK
jgi:hypothetical protein